MSQFRLTGTRYVSQWNGDDLNAGTDPTLPWASLFSTITSSQILGIGVYKAIGTGSKVFIGDGKAIISTPAYYGISVTATKIHFKNSFGFLSLAATDCIFENIFGGLQFRGNKLRCVFVGPMQLIGAFGHTFLNCIWAQTDTANPAYSTPGAKSYNYIANWSKFLFTPSDLALHVDNCCNGLLGLTSAPSVYYEAKLLIDGSPRPDANPAIPDIISVFPNFYIQGNFACEDPKFIDILTRTVKPESPLLLKSSVNGYIGGVKIGKKIDLDESGFTITKTAIDDSNPSFWKIAAGQTFAKIRITGKVSDSLISAQVLDIRIPFNFDGSEIGGTANNNNVPDAWNDRTTPDTKGTKPNRLTFEVRSSRLASPSRDVSADWDNDNTNSPSIAGRYYLTEYGQPMLHHVISAVAYGNADSLAINAASKLPFNYRSLDIIITISNTRVI